MAIGLPHLGPGDRFLSNRMNLNGTNAAKSHTLFGITILAKRTKE